MSFQGWEAFVNDDGTRTFLAVPVSQGHAQVPFSSALCLWAACNAALLCTAGICLMQAVCVATLTLGQPDMLSELSDRMQVCRSIQQVNKAFTLFDLQCFYEVRRTAECNPDVAGVPSQSADLAAHAFETFAHKVFIGVPRAGSKTACFCCMDAGQSCRQPDAACAA